jgi:hypothetical protein
MAGLHYNIHRSKLVHFEAQFFSMFKKALAYSNFCHRVNTTFGCVTASQANIIVLQSVL